MVPEVGGSSPLTRPNLCASGGMVDALVLGTSGQPWGFESLLAHQNASKMEYKNIEKKSYKSSFEVSLDQSAIAKIIDEKIENTSGGITFSKDNRFIFYTLLNEKHQPKKIFRHKL